MSTLAFSRATLAATMAAAVILSSACAPPTAEREPETAATGAAAVAPADSNAAAQALHDRVLVLDAHVDIVPPGTTSRYGDPDGSSKASPAKLKAGGVDAVVMAVAVGSGPRTPAGDAAAREVADVELAGVKTIVETHDDVVLARSADELEQAHARGETALMLGFQNARILEGEVAALDEFYAAGVRVFALTHLGHNDFADSSRPVYLSEAGTYEPAAEHGGLSELGIAAVQRINDLGGVVDVSQLSKAATLQAVEVSRTPVIASHSNVQALSQVTRNLTDEEIDQIGANGGVVHVAAFTAYLLDLSDPALVADIKQIRRDAGIDEQYTYPFELYWEIRDPDAQGAFLSAMRDRLGPADIGRFIDHVDYVVRRIGVDHVGLATDFNHGGGIQGFANASEALNVTVGLLERGYSESDIKKIWSDNFLRVLRAAEAGRSAS